jgi:hypothetical protein
MSPPRRNIRAPSNAALVVADQSRRHKRLIIAALSPRGAMIFQREEIGKNDYAQIFY